MEPPTLYLFSRCLLSKWGFNDGDMPDSLMDYWDEIGGVDYVAIDWNDVLRRLVRSHLLPELEKHHQITLVEIITLHNPIRAERVDGVEVDHYEDSDLELIPEFVEIPYSAVAEACGIGE